ncbi:MAG: hypothetical protein RMJ35_07445 [Phycisphaerales bacterium]|nr:hypothetical protein [Phycisphaerales bacterium]
MARGVRVRACSFSGSRWRGASQALRAGVCVAVVVMTFPVGCTPRVDSRSDRHCPPAKTIASDATDRSHTMLESRLSALEREVAALRRRLEEGSSRVASDAATVPADGTTLPADATTLPARLPAP